MRRNKVRAEGIAMKKISSSRRKFLKGSTKVLPVLAVMGLAFTVPLPAHADCNNSCEASCYKGCTGSCMDGCEGSCMRGCTGSCMQGCEGGSK
jgi:CXXX repeat radical SAM target protein